MKSIYELSDEEVLTVATGSPIIASAVSGRTGNFNLASCVGLALEEISQYFKKSNGLWIHATLPKEQADELSLIHAHYGPMVWERLRGMRAEAVKKQTVTAINFARARAIVGATFDVAGFKWTMSEQRYRTQVAVRLGPHCVVRFYLYYKDLAKSGRMDEVVDALRRLSEARATLGGGLAIKRG